MNEQLQAILRNEPQLTDVVAADRIHIQPIVRPGDDDPDTMGLDPTPQAFDPVPPRWLKTNIVVGTRLARLTDNRGRRLDSLSARWGFTLAYYVGPDGFDLLPDISWLVSVAFGRRDAVVRLPNGRDARVVTPHSIGSAVPVPEFPGAGFVLLERFELPTLWIPERT